MAVRDVSPPIAVGILLLAGSAVLPLLPVPPPDPRPPRALEVDLNTAPPRILVLLRNIGPIRAAAIAADRQLHGPYLVLEDLLRVHGIGPATVAELARAGGVVPPPSGGSPPGPPR